MKTPPDLSLDFNLNVAMKSYHCVVLENFNSVRVYEYEYLMLPKKWCYINRDLRLWQPLGLTHRRT